MRTEKQRAYDREWKRAHRTEEDRRRSRETSRRFYYKNKERKALEEAQRKKEFESFNLPEAPDILKEDCCKICKRFSGKSGYKEGWCLKKKKSTTTDNICGDFSPITVGEKFTQVIYKTPGVKYIKGSD